MVRPEIITAILCLSLVFVLGCQSRPESSLSSDCEGWRLDGVLPEGWSLIPQKDLPISCKMPWWTQNPQSLSKTDLVGFFDSKEVLSAYIIGYQGPHKSYLILIQSEYSSEAKAKAAYEAMCEKRSSKNIFYLGRQVVLLQGATPPPKVLKRLRTLCKEPISTASSSANATPTILWRSGNAVSIASELRYAVYVSPEDGRDQWTPRSKKNAIRFDEREYPDWMVVVPSELGSIKAHLQEIVFNEIPRISLPGDATGDKELVLLGKHPSLQTLRIGYAPSVTDKGVAALRNCSALRALEIGYSPNVTDVSMKAISHLPALEDLKLSGCKISDIGVEELSSATRLKTLVLTGKLSDSSLEIISKLPNIAVLSLAGNSELTDKGVLPLLKLKKLETLVLYGASKITDCSLDTIAQIRTLKALDVRQCPRLSKEKIKWFKKQMPDCSVQND
jgi:hypothetical protein